MKISFDEIREINEKIDLVKLIEANGFEYKRITQDRIKLACPFHPGDNDPSLVVYIENKPQTWCCFGCGKGAYAIHFLKFLTGKSFSDIYLEYNGPEKVFSLEDRVRKILETPKNKGKNNFLELIEACGVEFSIKSRTILRKKTDKLQEIHSIMSQVDDLIDTGDWKDMSEFEVKDFFRKRLDEMRNV